MADTLAAGSMVAHYRVVSRLGEGGMGAVYLADDTRLGRRVANVRAIAWQGDERRPVATLRGHFLLGRGTP